MPSPAQIQYNRANGLPDPYQPKGASPASAATAGYPAWLAQMDAQPQKHEELPDGVPLDGQAPNGVPGGAPQQHEELPPNVPLDGQLPPWLVQIDAQAPENVTVWGNKPETFTDDLGDLAANVGTGIARIPGAVIGTPQVLMHTLDWLGAKIANMVSGGNRTGADVDANNPIARNLPTSQDVDNKVFKGISAATGRDVQPYEPQSFVGQLLQAAVTGAGAGLADPAAAIGVVKAGAPVASMLEGAVPRMTKTAVASDAANAADQIAPDNPGLAATAAFLAHAGASGVGAAAKAGGSVTADAMRQVFRPSTQGELEAGRVLGKVDNTQPGLATPTDADLNSATGDVRTATNGIGPGQQPWQAGAELRAGLQTRADALRASRSASAYQAFEAFRDQPPLPASQLEPFMRSPSFRKALAAANGAVLDEGGEPLTKYFEIGDDGDIPTHLTGEAIPPDVLQRVKSYLGSAAGSAPTGSPESRTAGILDKRFGDFLENQYPAAGAFPGYGAIRQGYADASRPLDDFAYGPVAKTLDADKQFGQSRYTLADERVPDLFLRSKATRADLNQLIAASGGDRATALSALQDHLAGVAQSAVKPDGTLDVVAFDKAMKPYQQSLGNLGYWFPELAQKFSTAKQAQATLDNLQAQRGLADAVNSGALRDSDGTVTGTSMLKWLNANKAALSKTQDPAAVMRLQALATTLQGTHPGELADALKSEIGPAMLGTVTAGLEGGVLATLLHRSAKTAFGSLDAKRQAAFSAAIEQAVTDPAYAARLATTAARAGKGLSPARALARAVVATPLAINAGAPGGQ